VVDLDPRPRTELEVLRLLLPVAGFALTLYCLLDLALTDRRAVRSLTKVGWFAIVLMLPVVGAGLWLLLGRPGTDARPGRGEPPRGRPGEDARRPGGPGTGRGGPGRRPRGPEDDPRFLRDLDDQRRRDED
jgi:hypothetical protein